LSDVVVQRFEADSTAAVYRDDVLIGRIFGPWESVRIGYLAFPYPEIAPERRFGTEAEAIAWLSDAAT